ncbi:MAG: DegT/DnrJ/EryC1/StrS family aminotransferase [Arcicella sp.]|nr:DegT/DnrJ/EryC1/StrS family aminotransferase [Arcicella sp.]
MVKIHEFHAAMGLCVLPRVTEIIKARKQIFDLYDSILNWDKLVKPVVIQQVQTNYAVLSNIFRIRRKS